MKKEETVQFDPKHPLAHIGRKIFIAISIVVLVIVYYITRYSKGTQVIESLIHAAPLMVFWMIVCELMYLGFQGLIYKRIYRLVDLEHSVWYLILMYISMNMVNTLAPFVGLSGAIYMMYFEHRKGVSKSDTLLINFAYYITDYIVFLIMLILGLAYLLYIGQITRTIIITSIIFASFVFLVLLIFILLFSDPKSFRDKFHKLNNFLSKYFSKRKKFVSTENIETMAYSIEESWVKSKKNWSQVWRAAFFALGLHLSCLAMLWLAFLTFHIDVNLQILIAGYTVATLLNIVSVTPSGIGFAEGGMTAVFAALGVPVEKALLVSLFYRTIFIWFPLLLGLISINLLPVVADKEAPERI